MSDMFDPRPQLSDPKIMIRYRVGDREVERQVYGVDQLFNETTSKLMTVGFILNRGQIVSGYFEDIINDDGEFCVKVRSAVRDNVTTLLPVDSVIGWFYL